VSQGPQAVGLLLTLLLAHGRAFATDPVTLWPAAPDAVLVGTQLTFLGVSGASGVHLAPSLTWQVVQGPATPPSGTGGQALAITGVGPVTVRFDAQPVGGPPVSGTYTTQGVSWTLEGLTLLPVQEAAPTLLRLLTALPLAGHWETATPWFTLVPSGEGDPLIIGVVAHAPGSGRVRFVPHPVFGVTFPLLQQTLTACGVALRVRAGQVEHPERGLTLQAESSPPGLPGPSPSRWQGWSHSPRPTPPISVRSRPA
jgi:hypothetical protein